MTPSRTAPTLLPEHYEIGSLDDEIRVDRLCSELLQRFATDQVASRHLTPLEAGSHARGADYFLREFVIADRRDNLFKLMPRRIRQFAGHWYIIRNLEPNLTELEEILAGVTAFYDYLVRQQLYPADLATAIGRECAALDYYRQRIEAFWTIEGDGYQQWQRDCPLEATGEPE